MAWQSSSAMAGNGGMGGGNADGVNGGHPQGTEYTLQGVMRFLQTEWHRHERDRNAWEIERAEMKSRIGRLEGDARTSKRIHESLGKHIRILEMALRREREKAQKLTKGENVDSSVDPKQAAKESLNDLAKKQPKPLFFGLDNHVDDAEGNNTDMRHGPEREKSRQYLTKCTQEVVYHVIPGSHPSPEINDHHELMNAGYQNQQMSQPPLEDGYSQQQQQHQQLVHQPQIQHQQQQQQPQQQKQPQKQQQPNHVNMVRESSTRQPIMSNYNQDSGQALPENQPDQDSIPSLEFHDKKAFEQQRTHDASLENRNAGYDIHVNAEAPLPAENHAPNSSNEPEPPTEESKRREFVPEDILVDEADGWNFDEPVVHDNPPAPRRPDTDVFPNANFFPQKSSPRGRGSSRRKSSGSRRTSGGSFDIQNANSLAGSKPDASTFKVRFALRGHLDVVRSVIFTGGGSPSEPEICTSGDDGTIKRWVIPASYGIFGPNSSSSGSDLDVVSYFTHRGHSGSVTCLAACPPSQNFSNGGRALGDGWIFSGGQDATVKVWERGRVDPKATMDGHSDAVWSLCVLPGTSGSVFEDRCNQYGGPDRILLASGAADGTILIWAVSTPPQLSSPQAGSRGGRGGSRRANSVSSGSNFPTSPQPSIASTTPFHYSLVHRISQPGSPSPTFISPLSLAGVNFVVSYTDASILIYDTRTGEKIVGMASLETYDGTRSTGVNAVVATTVGFDGTADLDPNRGLAEEEAVVHGATGSSGGVEGVIISGYEDRYIRFFDANSGQCTYTMLAHPSAIASLSLSPDGRELVSAGHDASLRFWSLEKRSCIQEITSHRLMRGEGVCSVVWSQDGRWVVSGGGDGVVKIFSR